MDLLKVPYLGTLMIVIWALFKIFDLASTISKVVLIGIFYFPNCECDKMIDPNCNLIPPNCDRKIEHWMNDGKWYTSSPEEKYAIQIDFFV